MWRTMQFCARRVICANEVVIALFICYLPIPATEANSPYMLDQLRQVKRREDVKSMLYDDSKRNA